MSEGIPEIAAIDDPMISANESYILEWTMKDLFVGKFT